MSMLLYIYLHTDRLGSGSAVTDGRGKAVHILGYMPYGETLLDLSHTHYETPYQFTGYEKDQETGLHYAGACYYDSWLSIFNSTDPMWYKYPHQSPYAYSADNPVMLVDPDGRDPIYAKKFWGGVRKIGDDGKCGSGSYLVRGSIARDVKAATRAGEFYSGDLSQGNNVMHIPTGKIVQDIQITIDNTINSGNSPEERVEYGGHSLYGDKTARLWDKGSPLKTTKEIDNYGNETTRKEWKTRPFMIRGNIQIGGDYDDINFIWHIHPNYSVPSDIDMRTASKWQNKGYSGNPFVIGLRDGKVTYYNKNGSLITIKLIDFIRMSKQEDIK